MQTVIANSILVAVIAGILGLAVFAIVRAKKKGQKCIGCPDSSTCAGQCGGCCGCNQE